jgi:hypothetical protein
MYKKVKVRPYLINLIHDPDNRDWNDLELLLKAIERLIKIQVGQGKKGLKFHNGQKLSYKKAQGLLFELYSYFGDKGCFTGGICGDCQKFNNSMTESGTYGYCGDKNKFMLDGCTKCVKEAKR